MSSLMELRVDRPNQTYEDLRMMIIRGRLAPGVRVIESDIAQRLGVSRTPAREAIQRLFQEGFLASTGQTPRTELLVAPLTSDDMWDLYRTMSALEGAAALEVATLSDAECRSLAKQLTDAEGQFERAARNRKDFDTLFDLHNAFHERLVAVFARPRLRSLIATVRPQVDRYEWVYAPLVGPDFRPTFMEHAQIIQAVRQGSGKRAQRAITNNWEQSASRLGRIIESAGARGDWGWSQRGLIATMR